MTDFEKSFEQLIKYEGGYSDDPVDTGGETYKGISRNNFPDWRGWAIIDDLKGNPGFPGVLDKTPLLQDEVKKFYKAEFWDKLQLDIIGGIIAGELFEQAVNMGVSTASKHLQRTLNLLNDNERHYRNLKIDGVIGNITLSSLKVCLHIRGEKIIFNILNHLQACKYIELMERREQYEKYIGWFKRIEVIHD